MSENSDKKMPNPINTRMRLIRESTSLDQSAFAKTLGVKQPSYSAMETTSKSISGPVLRLLEILYNVNIEFLLHGKGPMVKIITQPTTSYQQKVEDTETNYHSKKEIENNLLNKRINDLERIIEMQDQKILQLTAENNNYKTKQKHK